MSLNGEHFWRYLGPVAVALVMGLAGTVIGKTWSEREMAERMRQMELQFAQLTATVSGDRGYGADIAELENRVRDLEQECP